MVIVRVELVSRGGTGVGYFGDIDDEEEEAKTLDFVTLGSVRVRKGILGVGLVRERVRDFGEWKWWWWLWLW